MEKTTMNAQTFVTEVEAQNNESMMILNAEYEPDERFWKEAVEYAASEFAKSLSRDSSLARGKVMIAANLYAKSNIFDFEKHIDAVCCDMISFIEGAKWAIINLNN